MLKLAQICVFHLQGNTMNSCNLAWIEQTVHTFSHVKSGLDWWRNVHAAAPPNDVKLVKFVRHRWRSKIKIRLDMVQYAMGLFPRVKFGPDRRRCLVQEPPKLKIWSTIAVFRCFSALQDDNIYDVKVNLFWKCIPLVHSRTTNLSLIYKEPQRLSVVKSVFFFAFFHPAMWSNWQGGAHHARCEITRGRWWGEEPTKLKKWDV